jgi:apolipoprotein D and lipocalin family protein
MAREHNDCVTDSGGLDQADEVATVVDRETNARLTVAFDNFFARLFGSSRDGNDWILSRTPRLDGSTDDHLVAREPGFPVSDLSRTTHASMP